MRRALALGALVLVIAPSASAQNLVINGDFEINTAAGCQFNLDTATFATVVSNAASFGIAQEVDVMDDAAGCTYGDPPPGPTTKIGLSGGLTQGGPDGVALELSEPVVSGRQYRLSLLVEGVTDFQPAAIPFQVGLSSDPTTFGTPVFSDTAQADAWTAFASTIVAPVGATHLTVQSDPGSDGWNHVDRLSLEAVALDPDHFQCYQAKDLKNPKFLKQTGVSVMDQFGLATVDIKKPQFVCAPADVGGSGINDPDTHMCCYQSTGPTSGVDVETSDSLGTVQLKLKKAKLVCAPCSKTLPLP